MEATEEGSSLNNLLKANVWFLVTRLPYIYKYINIYIYVFICNM